MRTRLRRLNAFVLAFQVFAIAVDRAAIALAQSPGQSKNGETKAKSPVEYDEKTKTALLNAFLEESNKEWRDAAESLVKNGGPEITKQLEERLKNASPMMRERGVYFFIRASSDPVRIEQVVLNGLRDKDVGVRIATAHAITWLPNCRTSKALALLDEMARSDNHREAAFAFGAAEQFGPGANSLLPALDRTLRNRKLGNPDSVRSGAASAIGKIAGDSPNVVRMLQGILADDSDDLEVRFCCAIAIRESKSVNLVNSDLLKIYRRIIRGEDRRGSMDPKFAEAVIGAAAKAPLKGDALPDLREGLAFALRSPRETAVTQEHIVNLALAASQVGSDAADLVPGLLDSIALVRSKDLLANSFAPAFTRILGKKAASDVLRSFAIRELNPTVTERVEVILKAIERD